jgi:very-short-patch-repair endonuclease
VGWWEIARAQAGVISHEQLLTAGVSASAVDRMAESGALSRRCHGVYLAGGAPRTELSDLWTAHLATDGVLALTTAGRLWGVYDGAADPIHVVVATDRHITTPAGVKIRRSALPAEALAVHTGLPVTSRRWTVLDLLGWLDSANALRLADRAVQRRWIDQRDCERRLAQYPKRRGNARLRAIAAKLGDGAAADSERLLHRLLRRAGIRDWTPNYPVWHDGALVGVIDVAIPHRRLAIEVDGMAYHTDTDRFQRDRAKQNALIALGWTVLRFTWADLTQRPGYVIAMLQRLAA